MKKGKAQGTLAKFSRESHQVTTGQDLVGLQEATAAVRVYFNVQFVSLAFAAALACALVYLEFPGGIAWFGTVAAPVFPFALQVGFFAHEWSCVTAAACAAAAGCDLLLLDVAAGMHCAFVGMSTLEGESSFAFQFMLTVLALAAAFERFCKFVHGTTELWGITSLQGSHFAWSNQGTPRVDVGGSPQAPLQQAAAAFNPGLGAFEGYQWLREKGGCRDEVAPVCQNPGLLRVFVVGLDGRTLVYRVPGDLAVQDLRTMLESTYSDADPDWYLMHNSKPLLSGPLSASVCNNARITMNGRLRGGMNSVPGAWFCPTCNQGGCWPARRSCFRCGQPRPAQAAVPIPPRTARRKKGFFGEEQFLEWQPQTGSAGCPTTPVPAGNAPPNGPLPPGDFPLPPLNADMMLAWLRQVGIGTEVIAQVTSKLPPPQSPPPRKPERILLDLANKKEQLQGALQKL